MKNRNRAGFICLLLLLVTALVALPALATEEDPAKDVVTESASVTVPAAETAPANTPDNEDDPEPAAPENEEAVPPGPDPDTADGQIETPVEEVPEVVFHTVLFAGHNNAILETQQVEDGKCAKEPSDPAAPEGYAFAHWYDDAGNGQAFKFATPITHDMKLRAKYVETVPELDDGEAAVGEMESAPEEEEPEPVLPEEEAEPVPEEGEPEVLPGEVQAEVVSGPPRVEVEYAFEGDVLLEGAKVVLTARVYNIPEDTVLSFQWQNDATGRFEDVSGATEQTYTFYADAMNSGCQWRVKVEGRSA